MLFILIILFSIQSNICQSELSTKVVHNDIMNYNDQLLMNNTLTNDNLFTQDSLNTDSSVPQMILEYPSARNRIRAKYLTDEEDYTSNESIAFSIYPHQEILQTITVLAGFAYENIHYLFDIENGRLKITFSQEKQPDVILTTRNDSELITNGRWYRLYVQRADRKLRFILDNVEQSSAELSDGWQVKTNIFIGSELTPAPNADYNGQIGDIMVTNSGRSLNLHEEDHIEENLTDFTTMITSSSTDRSESIQTIAFPPNDNHEIIFPSPINSSFQSLSFSFRTHSNRSTLLQFEEITLNIDIDGYLSLAIRNRQTQRIFSDDEEKPINDGNLYFIQLQLNNQTLAVWIDVNKKISVELSSSVLIVTNFIFGFQNQFLGCIENVTYNNQIFTFEHLSSDRQHCSSSNVILKSINDIYIDQIISFEEYDRPLIVTLDNPQQLHSFSFSFYTQEADSIICSLADETYENILILSVRHEQLFLTYHNKQNKRTEISMNKSITDRNEHKIMVQFINKSNLVFQLDDKRIIKNIPDTFPVHTIYMGKLDGLIKERYSNLDGDDFIGCMKDIMLNEKSLIKLEDIYRSNRLGNTCRSTTRERKDMIVYMSSDISFSVRDYHDIIELEIPINDEFYHCQLSIKTRSLNGIILSLYSNDDDDGGLILFLKNGKLHLKYHSIDDTISQFIFNDNQTINDGQQHDIFISRQISKLTSYNNMYIEIDRRGAQISFPSSSLLFFDVITIGGSHREMSTNVFVGCFSNITYNHHPVLPEGIVKFDRYDCFYDQDSICDKQLPCHNIQPLQFCGQTDCSLVCAPLATDMNKKGLLRYFSAIEPGEYEQIYLTIFTTAGNSTLFATHNGSIQVSIILQDYYPRLIIQNGGIIYTYDFPGRVRDDQWHILQCQKTLNTIDLTFDDETKHYTNLTEHFTFFTDNLIHICGGNFHGYIQDIILTADNHYENLIQNSIHNPGLIDYDASVTWNNRANIPECKFDQYVKQNIDG